MSRGVRRGPEAAPRFIRSARFWADRAGPRLGKRRQGAENGRRGPLIAMRLAGGIQAANLAARRRMQADIEVTGIGSQHQFKLQAE